MKLHQVIAVVNGKKTRVQATLTEIYHKLQKAPLFEGLLRCYEPLDPVEGDKLPEEEKRIQYTVQEAIEEATTALIDLFDSVATQDLANCEARANITVSGKAIFGEVPVTHLLFLDKQLVDIRTFITKIPVLDTADEWTLDSNTGRWRTPVSEGIKTKKVARNHVKAEATPQHPAQVEMYFEDVRVGTWRTIKFSGAIPARQRNEMLARVEALQEAVKQAREAANDIEVTRVNEGAAILGYVFGDR